MNSPKKDVELSKAVLNITTYKSHPSNDFAEIRQQVAVDITELLREYGIDSICQVQGVSAVEHGEMVEGYEALSMLPTVTEPQVSCLEKKICDIIDAAIVNDKQGKAIKKLIGEEFDDFKFDLWDDLKQCDFVKEYVDKLFDEELSKH